MANTTLEAQNLTRKCTFTQTGVLSGIEIFIICLYIVIVIVGLIGNGLVIFVAGYKMRTTVNSIWFLNLAIADFIFILVLILNIVTTIEKMWRFGDFMCKLVSFMSVLNMFASIFLLTAISLDRCMSTWSIVWAQNKRTLVKANIICTSVWVLSFGCSIPFVWYRSITNEEIKYCAYQTTLDIIRSLFLYRFIVGFLIPFLIIAASYIAIGIRAKRLKRGKKLKPFRVIISVILAFFICWFPFHVLQVFSVNGNWSASVEMIICETTPFVTSLAYLNSCLNPILYVFMCDEYKKKLKQSLLLVLESAFSEDHLAFLSTRYSTCSRLSESQGHQHPNDTISSSASNQDNRTTL